MKNLLSALLLGLTGFTAAAQTAPAFTSVCSDRGSDGSNRQYCEIRDLTLPAPGTQPLTIDGQANGGIKVTGWDGADVRVRARVTTWAKTDAEAAAVAKDVSISTSGNALRAAGPSGVLKGWAVSYEVFVPRRTALALQTTNGGISLADLNSTISFETTNGGISLTNVAGAVKGHTTNGGVSIQLSGTKWEGQGLDVATTNGGITWTLPKDYSARLVTRTTHGGISAKGLPVTKSGLTHKEIATDLGQGGATIQAVTTNGGISIRQ